MKKICKGCGKTYLFLNPQTRNTKFCSVACRTKSYDGKYGKAYFARRRILLHKKRCEGRIKCRICGLYFHLLSAHVTQTHKVSTKEYKERFGLDRGHGLLSDAVRKKKRDQAIANGTIENILKNGAKYRFKKGDPRFKYERRPETIKRILTKALPKAHRASWLKRIAPKIRERIGDLTME